MAGEKILIIEDDSSLVKILKHNLEDKGYEVFDSSDGESGLKQLNEVKPDLVILDVVLPKIGGIEIYKKISGADGKPPMPVLILTSREELEDFFESIEADGFISKPIEISHLMREVKRIIEKRPKPSVLLIDRVISPYVKDVKKAVKKSGYKMVLIGNLDPLEETLRANRPSCILMEYTQGKLSGEEKIKKMKDTFSKLPKDLWRASIPPHILVYNRGEGNYSKECKDIDDVVYIGKVEGAKSIIDAFDIMNNKILEEVKLSELGSSGAAPGKPSMSDFKGVF